ncbi:MAG TPA: efflux RND transporter periplasmic adaptor subunit [Burkholderiaceae bacterium]|nr:efflux RND transporter periplasmic adaptor subunit [Burkholderiaceae bacterium]
MARSKSKVLPVLAVTVVLLAGTVGGYFYFHAPVQAAPQAAAPQAMPVAVAAALEKSVTEWDEFSGRLEAIERVEIRARVAGYVDSIHFTPGALVKKGDLLFVIDPQPYAAEVARAEATLAAARARVALTQSELARAEVLLQDGAVAQRAFDERRNAHREAQASVQAAESALQIARLNLNYTRIAAPISGRVSRAEVTVGNLVAAGASGPALTSIVSTSPIYATFEADERTFLKYAANLGKRPGDRGAARIPIHMGLAHDNGHPREGIIEFVDNRIDPQSGTIRVRAVFDNKDGVLTPGLFARLKVGGAGERSAVLVNDRAVGTDQNRKFVFVVGPDQKVAYREVKLGPVVDGLRVVREGLTAGETIVVNGIQRVRPGALVAPNEVRMDEKSELVHQRGKEERAAQSDTATRS